MDNAEVLFDKYPRWTGPNQKMIYNREQLLRHVYCFSGLRDVFTSVYAFPFAHGIPLIDKLFCDIDEEPEVALKRGQELFEWTTENDFETAVNWTGAKGPHIYPLCPNIVFDDRAQSADYIKKAVYYILEETGLFEYKEIIKMDGEKEQVKVPLVDSSVIGDIRRLTRYTGTRRASVFGLQLPSYCIAIDPKQFLDLSIKDIFELEREPYPFPDINIKRDDINKHFHELDLDRIKLDEWRGADNLNIFINKNGMPDVPKNDITELFKILLPRRCVHKFITLPDAPAPIRFAATCELHRAGLKSQSIMNLFRKLNWTNFQEEETAKQVSLICSKGVDTIGKKKMIEMGFCSPDESDACNNCR